MSSIASLYGHRLRRFFSLRLSNSADALDLAQEVFLRLMRVQHHETIRSPEAYVFTIASHVLHQHTLRRSTGPVTVDIFSLFGELEITSLDDPSEDADTQQRLDQLARALARLPARVSTTLILHRFAGFSIEEIAQSLGVSRPTAKKYLARALTHCRNAHERQESEKTR